MTNPWLNISLYDYEKHMGSAEVQQLSVLSELFAEALGRCQPESVAILGIAGGNGLEHVDGTVTQRIVALDVNPQYLEAVLARYSSLRGLALCCVDLSRQRVDLERVQLVHAALIFEHAGTGVCLENAIAMIAPGGNLSVVLQLPTANGQTVGASRVSSMQKLESHFSLVDSEWLGQTLVEHGFRQTYQETRALHGGKAFWMGVFRAPE